MKKMVRVYPADKQGRCLRGFCPTICENEEADQMAHECARMMAKYGFKYDHIVVDED